ncbi:CPCC family cysteine-rich protein [Aquihabitans daechungensis]|uniref:CPCC family cysteine-rich protein n=1 Tax=Aquihabitans daechungensis TaxID=1052257 RepID=UPI003B9E03F6
MPSVERGPNDDPSIPDEGLLELRNQWFAAYTAQKNVVASPGDAPYSCPCCGHVTLSERGAYEICGECGWEDDGQDDHDCDTVRGGPNGTFSLTQARTLYAEDGRPLPHSPPSRPV